jgi:hypothetical protein
MWTKHIIIKKIWTNTSKFILIKRIHQFIYFCLFSKYLWEHNYKIKYTKYLVLWFQLVFF